MIRAGIAEFDTRFGQPVIKDGCGIFGVIRKRNSPKISNLVPLNGISCIKYRGSNLGAGYASFEGSGASNEPPYRIKAFVRSISVAENLQNQLEDSLGSLEGPSLTSLPREGVVSKFGIWEANVKKSNCDNELEEIVDAINSSLLSGRKINGRIFSFGRRVSVFKEIGYPSEVAKNFGLDTDSKKADAWIAHTRQPTNSPGTFPIWSHPFSSLDCAIVHNGDISSFGANVELLNSWKMKSHVGTDSEVIARLLDHLIRVEGLSISQAATVLTNPFEENLSERNLDLLLRYRAARLDGPFTVVAGCSDSNNTYLIALTDRSKFRPILIGEDENCYYVASEENQIRNISKNAKVWTPEPGSFFIASVEEGMLEAGTNRNLDLQHEVLMQSLNSFNNKEKQSEQSVDTTGKEFRELNELISKAYTLAKNKILLRNVSGQRYLGIGISTGREEPKREFKIVMEGFPGNCLANLNDGAIFEVFGNVGDDLGDTMHSGSVIVHGNARDVVGQALQGGEIFVRGSVGNRAGIQMREYLGSKPFLIVGETVDDYLCEYMAGGVCLILNLSDSARPARNYIGTGMVGGTIYLRGKVKSSQVGLQPKKQDLVNYLRASFVDGVISKEVFEQISNQEVLSEDFLNIVLPHELLARIKFLFFRGKYLKPMLTEYRTLDRIDVQLISDKLHLFFRAFGLSEDLMRNILQSEFTVIKTVEEKTEAPLPPQEVPVEE